MIARFFALWLVVTMIVFIWTYLVRPANKQTAKAWFRKVAISAAISVALLGLALLSNNISGV